MSESLAAWVASRQPVPPAGLARALEIALADAAASGAPRAAHAGHADGATPAPALGAAAAGALEAPASLARAGMLALQRALALGNARSAAWELLAADALLTYAIERAAEAGVDSLSALLADLEPAAFAPLIEGEA